MTDRGCRLSFSFQWGWMMADFKEAFVAMWDNEGETWGREQNGTLLLHKIEKKTLYYCENGEHEWELTTAVGADLGATDWRKVDMSRKEVSWWEAWKWGWENRGRDFWYAVDGGEPRAVNYKDDTQEFPINRLVEIAEYTKWFIPVEPTKFN